MRQTIQRKWMQIPKELINLRVIKSKQTGIRTKVKIRAKAIAKAKAKATAKGKAIAKVKKKS